MTDTQQGNTHTPATEPAAPSSSPAAGQERDARTLAYILESVLFAAGEPLSLRQLAEILDGVSERAVQEALDLLRQDYRPGARGIHLVEVAGGFQFRTARENAPWVRALFAEKPPRLSRAALETLAIIAYRQPITKAEIEAIRGVDTDGPVQNLLQRGLIRVAGRRETVGRPLLYATTPEFLETFGLKSLDDLPPLPEGSELPQVPELPFMDNPAERDSHETHEGSQATSAEPPTGASQPSPAAAASGAGAETTEDFESGGPGFAPRSGTVDS